jgi:hypothetical protein
MQELLAVATAAIVYIAVRKLTLKRNFDIREVITFIVVFSIGLILIRLT